MLTPALLLLQGLIACTTPSPAPAPEPAPVAPAAEPLGKPFAGFPNAVRPEKNPFSVTAAPVTLVAGGSGQAELVFKVPQGTYLYREMAKVQVLEAGSVDIEAADLPPGVMRFDEAFGREREVWELDAVALLPLTAPTTVGTYTILLDVGYQGCRGGLCFMPANSQLELTLNVTESK
jgi:thiol:disulfide interchange protein